jgi:hypothetical protein
MFTRFDIIDVVKVAYARCLQFQALFHAAERQSLTVGIKAIGPGGDAAWGIWFTLLNRVPFGKFNREGVIVRVGQHRKRHS